MSGPIPTAARKAVKARDEGRCCRCGSVATDIHHRMRRREGGHGLWNLVSLCRADHSWAHANPGLARDDGYIISVHEKNPETIPLRLWTGDLIVHHADGTFTMKGRA